MNSVSVALAARLRVNESMCSALRDYLRLTSSRRETSSSFKVWRVYPDFLALTTSYTKVVYWERISAGTVEPRAVEEG